MQCSSAGIVLGIPKGITRVMSGGPRYRGDKQESLLKVRKLRKLYPMNLPDHAAEFKNERIGFNVILMYS